MHVTIPEPCHENWGEMTPTQRGAFCQKCAVDVIDFSGKSAQEIKATLDAHVGKNLCGRFEKKQLTDLNHNYHLWEKQTAQTFQSKFLWACLIAFGMTLFTGCETINAQEISTNMIEISTELEKDTNKIVTDTISNSSTIIEDITEPYTDFIFGDIAYDPNWNEPAVLEDTMVKPTSWISITPDSAVNEVKECIETDIKMGKIVLTKDTKNVEVDSVEQIKQPTKTLSPKALLYPNPTRGTATLRFTPEKNEKYVISVYTADGKLVQTVHKGVLNAVEQQLTISLQNQPSGLYFIEITSDKGTETVKINKVD